MSENSNISWTDHTFNPWEGCTKVSPGCAHCYAEARNKRFADGLNWGKGAPRRRTSAANWKLPIKWNREAESRRIMELHSVPLGVPYHCQRPRVFCASLADWLDEEVPLQWLVDLINLIAVTPNLDWLLLTKRPEGWRSKMQECVYFSALAAAWIDGNPPPNVWIGTTVEDQQRADERIPRLLNIPARIRFLSCEPLLEEVDLDFGSPRHRTASSYHAEIHWVIAGGESGPKFRHFDPAWARSLRDQCAASGVAFHMKQMGGLKPYTMAPIPEDLAIRQWPNSSLP